MFVREIWGEYKGFRTLIAHHVPSTAPNDPSWYCAYVRVPFVMVRNITMMKFAREFTYGTWLTSDEHPWKMTWPSGKAVENGCAVVGWDYNFPEENSLITEEHVRGDLEDFIDRVDEMIRRDIHG